MPDKRQLNGCPWCHSSNAKALPENWDNIRWKVRCGGCGAGGPLANSKEEAESQWGWDGGMGESVSDIRFLSLGAGSDTSRVETGVVQFGNDWPGVFIRGDYAASLVLAIDGVLGRTPKPETVANSFDGARLVTFRELLCKSRLRGVPPMVEHNNTYWKRLSNHPGAALAIFMTVALCVAADSFWGILVGLPFIAIVLWTNRSKSPTKDTNRK